MKRLLTFFLVVALVFSSVGVADAKSSSSRSSSKSSSFSSNSSSSKKSSISIKMPSTKKKASTTSLKKKTTTKKPSSINLNKTTTTKKSSTLKKKKKYDVEDCDFDDMLEGDEDCDEILGDYDNDTEKVTTKSNSKSASYGLASKVFALFIISIMGLIIVWVLIVLLFGKIRRK